MNLRPERRDEVELNMTSLIDVVLLLLIFFMVSTTFERQSELNITLPKASEEYTDPKVDEVNVYLDSAGRVSVNDRMLVNSQVLTIREALRDASHDMDNPPIIINADAQATHQAVIKIMDAARQLGLTRITFATQRLDEELSN